MYSHGLDTILRERSWKLTGILNGIDTESYNPATDPDIFALILRRSSPQKPTTNAPLQELMGLRSAPTFRFWAW